MRTEYSPLIDTLGATYSSVLAIGTDVDLAAAALPLRLETLYAGSGSPLGVIFKLNGNDRCFVRRAAIFCNLADGLVSVDRSTLSLTLHDSGWAATDDRINVIVPALNTWFDIGRFLNLAAGSTDGYLTLQSATGTFKTNLIDASLAGQPVRVDFMVEIAHSYGLEV